ncbi:hypothetical protein [Rhodococcus sp. NPDC058514]
MTESWARVGAAVDAGHVYLEQGVARRCAQRCAEFIVELKGMQLGARGLATIDGFGDLPSGVALAAKFGKKAVGGDYSMDQALADHITVVQEMQQVFEKIDAAYSASDQSGAQRFGGVGHGE